MYVYKFQGLWILSYNLQTLSSSRLMGKVLVNRNEVSLPSWVNLAKVYHTINSIKGLLKSLLDWAALYIKRSLLTWIRRHAHQVSISCFGSWIRIQKALSSTQSSAGLENAQLMLLLILSLWISILHNNLIMENSSLINSYSSLLLNSTPGGNSNSPDPKTRAYVHSLL